MNFWPFKKRAPKPRIVKAAGQWLCSESIDGNGEAFYCQCPVGVGVTPALAYMDWARSHSMLQKWRGLY